MSIRRTSLVICKLIFDRHIFLVRLFINLLINAVLFVIKSACNDPIMESQRLSPVSSKNFTQAITFNGSDTNCSLQIFAQDVTINCTPGTHNHGSSKVKLTNVVDYNWEHKYYPGHLLDVHVSGKYFAYGIKVRNVAGKGGGMVRVATHDSRMRTLIKDMNGQAQDIAFAHTYTAVILACVDEDGSLFVNNIEEHSDGLICTLLLHVVQSETIVPNPGLHRVVWCPYLPGEDDTDDDASKLLVLTHANKAELFSVAIINNKQGMGSFKTSTITDGYLEINEHAEPILDAAFAPDGTAVATASLDGYVKFFQIYMHEGTKPRCLHEWQPHLGKPLSYLAFLDNHSIYDAEEQFWKFAITGCNNNTELKVWSCESWTCLQTINFIPNPISPSPEVYLKVRLDLTSSYLLLSDINNRVLYILEMHITSNGSNAFARSISEFLLPAPVLSFAILEAATRKFRCSTSTEDLYACEDRDEFDDGANLVMATVVRMYVVQPKRLQELQVVFQPDECPKLSPNIHKKLIYKEPEEDTIGSPPEKLHYDLKTLLIQPPAPLNLMTPDAFNSPSKIEQNGPSPTEDNDQLSDIPPAKDNFASGGSSPSREVEEIMALNNNAHDYFEADKVESEDILADGWPSIPILKANEVLKTEDSVLLENGTNNVEQWMVTLVSLVREQSAQLEQLKAEIKNLKDQQEKCSVPEDLENVIAKQLDLALARSHAQQAKMFDSWATSRSNKDRENYESLVANLPHTVNKQMHEKLQAIVNIEMKQTVLPVVAGTFENLKHVLQDDFAQKLSSTELVLRENLNKFISSKTVADSLSVSITNVLRPSMEKCYKDVISNTLLPTWDRICNVMFQQLNDTFGQGTKEYTNSLETYLEKSQRRFHDKSKETIVQMQSISDTMRVSVDKLNGTLETDLRKQLNSMKETLLTQLTDIINEQMSVALVNHATALEDSVINAVRSRAVTPSPLDVHVQLAQIQQLLSQGQVNTAFQQALSAADLSLVVYICEKLNPETVFAQSPCPLQQHVLLSLIQQLSADMNNHTEVKRRYLEEAVLNLDPTYPVTKEHMSSVLRELLRQLTAFINLNPNHKTARSMKMLQMAAKSLLKT